MHVYLDSRDLIVLVEKNTIEETASFEEKLHQSSSKLIFSMHNIMECCAPLVHGGENSSVMKTLNRLEKMPHAYVAETRIEALELQEATSAFLKRLDYSAVALPFVPRFDYVISPFAEVATQQYLQYGLAHIVYELWNTDKSLLVNDSTQAMQLRELLRLNRTRSDYRDHESNFQNMVARNLRLYGIQFPSEAIKQLSEWIYEDPMRCPAVRLGYEIYHKLLRNLTDGGADSDIPDFAHISCVPYCDAVTLDKRMRGYVAQVDNSIGTNYSRKVYRNVGELEQLLCHSAA